MSCLVLFFAKTLSFWALSGRGRWSRNRQERGRAAPADASFPRAGHVTRAREEGGRCLALSLARGWGGTRGLLPRTSSGPGGGWQKQGARQRCPPVSGPPHACPRAVLGLHLSPVRSWGPVWFLIGDPQRLGSTRYVAGSRLEIHRSSSIVSPHLYQVASSIKDEEAEAQRRSLTHPRPYSWWLSP